MVLTKIGRKWWGLGAVLLFLSPPTFSKESFEKPNSHFFKSNRSFFINNNLAGKKKIRLKLHGIIKGENSFYPMKLYPYIKCGQRKAKPVDLAGPLYLSHRERYSRYIGAPHPHFPRGVLQVCGLQNVRMDSERLFISFYREKGDSSCDASQIVDLIYALSDLCE